MKFRIVGRCAALVLCLSAGPSQANPTIGGDTLLNWLKSRDERDGAMAVGYIGGVREVTFQKDHCASGSVDILDVVGAVRRALEAMPQYRHLPASWIVIETLKIRWPCTSSNTPKNTK